MMRMINKTNNIEKEDIKKELILNELNELIKSLIILILLACLFGYAGYIYCIDNNGDPVRGMIFGVLFPLGMALIKVSNFDKIYNYIIYAIVYILIAKHIPIVVGVIAILLIIITAIGAFMNLKTKDRTVQIEKLYNKKNLEKSINKINKTTSKSGYKDIMFEDEIDESEERYECEICFKKISRDEYESNDGMCEDCFMDIHTDEHGNFHDDEFFDDL